MVRQQIVKKYDFKMTLIYTSMSRKNCSRSFVFVLWQFYLIYLIGVNNSEVIDQFF